MVDAKRDELEDHLRDMANQHDHESLFAVKELRASWGEPLSDCAGSRPASPRRMGACTVTAPTSTQPTPPSHRRPSYRVGLRCCGRA
jgi:hypothetical protein